MRNNRPLNQPVVPQHNHRKQQLIQTCRECRFARQERRGLRVEQYKVSFAAGQKIAHHTLQVQRLRCTDADDQMFIDLAVSHRARWLLSRDRAVLKLARRAAKQGVLIMPPEAWVPRSIG